MNAKRWIPVALALSGLVAGSACTLFTSSSLTDDAPCESAGDCLAGYACQEGRCRQVSTEAPVPPPGTTFIGPQGGTVEGPDGVTLEIPASAFTTGKGVQILRGSRSTFVQGLELLSAPYVIQPEGTELAVAATLRIGVALGACSGLPCAVYELDATLQATALETTVVGEGIAPELQASLSRFSTYVAARPAGLDAGVPDAAPEDARVDAAGDAAPEDAADKPIFAACNFSASSCAAGMRCGPHPFERGQGFCTISCPADNPDCACASPDCACCRPLPGESVNSCLPSFLCGARGIGEPCETFAMCDFDHTDLCAEVQGEKICTRACTLDDEAEACGDTGCCVAATSAADSATFCEADADCHTLALGDRCVTGRGCASSTCRSLDGVAPARCTQNCQVKEGCGAGLCCYPASCSGLLDQWCAPEQTCSAAASEICGYCFSDDHCGDQQGCFENECIALNTCMCFNHSQCGLDQFCLIDEPTQATCEEGLPCCGECVELPPSVCFIDTHCPPPGQPDAKVCNIPAACRDDPFRQCVGECRPLQPGRCLGDEDCTAPEVCTDGECL